MGDRAVVRVIGRGTFKLAPSLKQFGEEMIRRGVQAIVCDMRHCSQMDSTFMGVIAGLATRLARARRGEIFMVNLSSRTRGLLATLGLDAVVRSFVVGSGTEELKEVLGAAADFVELPLVEDVGETRATILEAHRALMKVSDENAARFQDVVEFLEKSSGEKAEGEGGGRAG